MAKIGDIVRYLNSVGGGTITRIEGNVAYVDEDGFETPVMLRECVVVSDGSTAPKAPSKQKDTKDADAPKPTAPTKPAQDNFVVEETPGGEALNLVLAYEATDIKRLSNTTYDTYLVNDSNYYLYFTYLTSDKDSREWTSRYDGIVEPGIQVHIGTLTNEDLAEIDRVGIQYLAFKRGKAFEAKAPAFVNLRLDTTKFFKLHCFRPNMYFDQPVIALTIAENDVAAQALEIDSDKLAKAMKEKIRTDHRQARPAPKQSHKKAADDEPMVVDLHIAQIIDDTRGLTNADMLNLQIDTFRKVMDANLRNHGKKIVFIHGKGDGVLRAALLKELNYRYKGHEAQDASFREYGFGATQVKIK